MPRSLSASAYSASNENFEWKPLIMYGAQKWCPQSRLVPKDAARWLLAKMVGLSKPQQMETK